MHVISKDNPAFYFTAVAKDRLPVFQTDKIKFIVCEAIAEAKKSGGFALYAYVIMPDHLHLITDSFLKPSETLRYLNGIISHRVLGYLKENNFRSSLEKLRQEDKKRNYKYSLWNHHNNTFSITNEGTMMQKVNYIHQNPVEANLAKKAEDYFFSSARFWRGCPREDESLEVDLKKIKWRRS